MTITLNLLLKVFKSNSNKSLVIVGDVPYNDDYNNIKSLKSNKVILTGYVTNQADLSAL